MKKIGHYGLKTLFIIFCLVFTGYLVLADDTCVFSVTADDMTPNMVLLPDEGTETEQVVGQAGFDNSIDNTPVAAPEQDAPEVPGTDILSGTFTFMAPVVPGTRTFSGDKIYMAIFKPGEGNFWQGNVAKYGISSNNQIVDANGDAAARPNGAVKSDAVPYQIIGHVRGQKEWIERLSKRIFLNHKRCDDIPENLAHKHNPIETVKQRLFIFL